MITSWKCFTDGIVNTWENSSEGCVHTSSFPTVVPVKMLVCVSPGGCHLHKHMPEFLLVTRVSLNSERLQNQRIT